MGDNRILIPENKRLSRTQWWSYSTLLTRTENSTEVVGRRNGNCKGNSGGEREEKNIDIPPLEGERT